jgi:hypothetical protein
MKGIPIELCALGRFFSRVNDIMRCTKLSLTLGIWAHADLPWQAPHFIGVFLQMYTFLRLTNDSYDMSSKFDSPPKL